MQKIGCTFVTSTPTGPLKHLQGILHSFCNNPPQQAPSVIRGSISVHSELIRHVWEERIVGEVGVFWPWPIATEGEVDSTQAAKWAEDGGYKSKGSIQGPSFLPIWHTLSPHVLLMEALAVPLQNKFRWFPDGFHSLAILVGNRSKVERCRACWLDVWHITT